MKKMQLKRITSIILCIAIFISCICTSVVNVGAVSSDFTDDFEDGLKWSQVDQASLTTSDTCIAELEGGNHVILPKDNATGVSRGDLSDSIIYTYNNWPASKRMTKVTGTIHATNLSVGVSTLQGLVIIYYYKDNDNWRGLSFGTGGQSIRFCGVDGGTKQNFATYGTYISGTMTAISGLDTTFTITYNSNGTATMVMTNSTGTCNTITLPTGATNFGGSQKFTSTIDAGLGKFALGNLSNKNAANDYFDNISVEFEKTAEEEADAFKTKHAAILAKTTSTVVEADGTAIETAITELAALSTAAQGYLTTEKALLDSLGNKIFGAAFDKTEFTEDFSGKNYWLQVGETSTTTSPIVSGAFLPGISKNIDGGKLSVYTHMYWPQRDLKQVDFDFTFGASYGKSSLIIYYYKDTNNWRGFYIQRTSGATNIFYVMKETDANDATKVYYKKAVAFDYQPAWENGTMPAASSVVKVKLTYNEDDKIKLYMTQDELSLSNPVVLSDAFTAKANNMMVSTDSGATFSTYTETESGLSQGQHKFAAITDGSAAKFGMGALDSQTSFDNIKFTFCKKPQEEADEFKTAHATILAKTVETVAAADKTAVETALTDYNALGTGAKALLTTEKALLDAMSTKLVAAQFDVNEFTEDFSGVNYWEQVGTPSNATANPISGGKFTPITAKDYANGLVSLYAHKYWPNRDLKEVNFKFTFGAQNAKSALIIYYYKDANNWRGFYIQRTGGTNLFYVMKETDANDSTKVYYKKSVAFDLQPQWKSSDVPAAASVVDAKLTYNENGKIKLYFTQDTKELSSAIVLSDSFTAKATNMMVSTDSGATFSTYTGTEAGLSEGQHKFAAITDGSTAQFAMGAIDGTSAFDDITVSFQKPASEDAAEFKTTYATALALTTDTVALTDKTTVDAALAAFDGLSAGTKALLTAEGALLENLAKAIPVNNFKTTHADILAKTVLTVEVSDIAAINAAITAYGELDADSKATLTAQNTLLGNLLTAAETLKFNADSFTDDFSGKNYWQQVGTPKTAGVNPIASGVFTPNDSKDSANGLESIHTHIYWPNRDLKAVSGKYYISSTKNAASSLIIYYYKDANNWRGVLLKRATNFNFNFVSKQSDPTDPTKVYYKVGNQADDIDASADAPLEGTTVDFKIDYKPNGKISITFSQGTWSKVIDGSSAFTSSRYETIMLSTDSGATFSAYTATETGLLQGQHKFVAITDGYTAKFAMGRGQGGSTFDDIKVEFATATNFEDLAEGITVESETSDILAAVLAYNELCNSADYNEYDSKYATVYESLIDVLVQKGVLERPEMIGATIKVAPESEQDLRFKSSFNTENIMTDYAVVEYGTVMLPNSFITEATNGNYKSEALMTTTKVVKADGSVATAAVAKGTDLPSNGEFFATLSGSASSVNCGVRIAARSYVKYSNGTNTFVVYSNNTTAGYNATNPTEGVCNGIAVRSVNSIAREMAVSIATSGSSYGTIVGTNDIDATVTANDLKTDTTTYTGSMCIEFVIANRALLQAIAVAQQA